MLANKLPSAKGFFSILNSHPTIIIAVSPAAAMMIVSDRSSRLNCAIMKGVAIKSITKTTRCCIRKLRAFFCVNAFWLKAISSSRMPARIAIAGIAGIM